MGGLIVSVRGLHGFILVVGGTRMSSSVLFSITDSIIGKLGLWF